MEYPRHWQQRIAALDDDLRINYIDCPSLPDVKSKGTILLIHGFPQTSYQFRHVIDPLSAAGYRVIVPDYRGAGQSSRPAQGFTKSIMAQDLATLVTSYLGIKEKIHIVGHDLGGMVAHAYASRHPDQVASIAWGECPLPGTTTYEENKTMKKQFHFIFHCVPDLPEALVAGRERIYLKHFFDKLALNSAAISSADLDHYTLSYSQPGAMRSAFAVYAAFDTDAEENKAWLKDNGKCKVPALLISGDSSGHASEAQTMVNEMYENAEIAEVSESGHWLAEENPKDFVQKVLAFVGKHE